MVKVIDGRFLVICTVGVPKCTVFFHSYDTRIIKHLDYWIYKLPQIIAPAGAGGLPLALIIECHVHSSSHIYLYNGAQITANLL